MQHILALIPARAGSKGIPGKNLALVAGKPLLAWTVEAARRSTHCTRLVVTTDSDEIAAVANRCGAETPFRRPQHLAADSTPGIAPVLHALTWLEVEENYRPECIVMLQPTSPLRTAEDVDAAVELATARAADAVVSVTPAEHHPFWMKRLSEDGRMSDFMSSDVPVVRRQDLPPVYALNGAIYLARRDVLVERENWYTEHTYGYVMPAERSLDIDTPWDLRLADLLLQSAPFT